MISKTVGYCNRATRTLIGLEVHRSKRDVRHWLSTYNIETVIDVGANAGQFADWILTIFPTAQIFCFEPLPDCVQKLKEKASRRTTMHVFPFACGETSRQTLFYESAFSPSSSLLQMGDLHKSLYPSSAATTAITVEERKLDEVLATHVLRGEILLKLDVQGAELRVLAGAQEVCKRSRLAICEVNFTPLYRGQAGFEELCRTFKVFGLIFAGMLSQTLDIESGQPLFGDAIFRRDTDS